MDDMYTTVQTACRMANLAHKREKRQHIVFREVGLYRIKPSEEIQEIVEEAIYGYTIPVWKGDATISDYPKGTDARVRPLFEGDCYWGVGQIETTVTPRLSQEDIRLRLLEQWQRKYRRPCQILSASSHK